MKQWSTVKNLMWLFAKLKGGASAIIETITGNLPLVLQNAIQHSIKSLTRYGLCTQDGTPTPDAPVDIMCNNGALKFGWYDIITTSALSGYGTYVSPSGTAGNRAYKWLKDLPNGTYQISVDGDYELIVQWRDPADPSNIVPSAYENLSGWMTSGEVVLDKEGGGYGIAVKRTSGTSSITPANFDGTLHVQEQGIYADGTPEVLTVSGENLLNPATNITGSYISANGSITSGSDAQYTDLIPVKAGETYVASFVSGRDSGNNRWHGYNANGGWVKQIASVSASGQQGAVLGMAATIDSGIAYVRLSYGINDTNAMIISANAMPIETWDGFYPSRIAGACALTSKTKISSPYAADPWRGPAVLCNVESGETYFVKHNLDNCYQINVTFFADENDVTDFQKTLGHVTSNTTNISFTPPDGAHVAVIGMLSGSSSTTYTFDENSITIHKSADYQPYVAPQTASVPMLLSVGDYKDDVEIISGGVTRKVGIKVFDGTETVNVSSAGNAYIAIDGVAIGAPNTPINTHFALETSTTSLAEGRARFGANGSTIYSGNYYMSHPTARTAADFKAWLASEYANGTPVIVLYPLATETTEHTTAQNLNTVEGTNIVDSVANVGPLTAEVKYMAASAQDVLSTLLGMRVTPKDISTHDAEDMIDIITGEDNK